MPEYDIFLSYAEVDNIALGKAWMGYDLWVGAFKFALQQALDAELGRKGEAKWFFDAKDLRTADHLSKVIEGALKETSLMVCLVSKGYFHDDSRRGIRPNCYIASKYLPEGATQPRTPYSPRQSEWEFQT